MLYPLSAVGWRWIFFVNVPLMMFAFLFGLSMDYEVTRHWIFWINCHV